MRSKVEYAAFEGGVKIIEYPEGFSPEEGFRERQVLLNCDSFEERISHAFLSGIHIEQRDVKVLCPYSLRVAHDFPFIKMQFEIQGYSNFQSKIASVMDVQIRAGHHQLMFIPEVKGELSYVSDRHTLEIKLMPFFLQKLFGEDLAPMGKFGKALLSGSPALLSSALLPITPAMYELVHSIAGCTYAGLMRKIFLECKVTELLLMQLEQVRQSESASVFKPKRSDLEKLHYARELIEQNLENPRTILQLSELSGLNDFKLKRDFKRLFGMTIFAYLTEFRLRRAKQLLSEGESISEVAYKMGYKHPQHFSAAFKRYYGYLPSQLRN